MRPPAFVGAIVMGATLLISACSSSVTHSATSASPTPSHSATRSGFQAGPDPCQLVTLQDISAAMNERMVKTNGSGSTCTYMNATTHDYVSVTTATMTPAEGRHAVLSTGRTVKVQVQHLSGLGGTAIAYLITSKSLNVATCLFAKNNAFVFLHVDSPQPTGILQDAISLAKTAASRI